MKNWWDIVNRQNQSGKPVVRVVVSFRGRLVVAFRVEELTKTLGEISIYNSAVDVGGGIHDHTKTIRTRKSKI